MPRLAPVIKTVLFSMFMSSSFNRPASNIFASLAVRISGLHPNGVWAEGISTRNGRIARSGSPAGLGSAAALEEEAADGGILGQANRPIERVDGLDGSSESLEKVRAHSPVRLVRRYRRAVQRIEKTQRRCGSASLARGGGLSDQSAERRRDADEPVVEDDDRVPFGAAGSHALGMDRLDGGLELETADSPEARRRRKLALGFTDRLRRP